MISEKTIVSQFIQYKEHKLVDYSACVSKTHWVIVTHDSRLGLTILCVDLRNEHGMPQI